jgi:quercetin dioxygenase-like cupin family protein
MDIVNARDVEETRIENFPYKGKSLKVTNVGIRWLSQAGPQEFPEYGLRFFTVGPGGEIPIHNHFYVQTMYILSGQFTVYSYDGETDTQTREETAGPHDVIFIPTLEPHSMKNTSDTQDGTFLCCIANVYEE